MRSFSAPMSVSLIAALLSGCAVGPNYQPPVTNLPDHFQHAMNAGEPATSAQPELSTWWQGFNDPVMTRVIATALAQNLDLEQAAARVRQVRAGVESAQAALLPAAQASASAARAHESLDDPVIAAEANSIPGFNRNSYFYDVGMSASWEIDLFGGLRRGAEAARADYQATAAASTAARLEVIAETANTYVLVRTLQARREIARQEIQTASDRVKLIRMLVSRGLKPDYELRNAQADQAATMSSLPALDNALTEARNALDVLMGRMPGTPDPELDAIAPIPTPPSVETAGGPAEMLRRRPDVIAAERHLAASNARIGEAISDYYPKFSLYTLVGSTTTIGGHLFENPANEALGAFGLKWRLFDFGRVDAEVRAAKGRTAEALAAYRLSVLRATSDVENALSSVAKYDEQEKLLSEGEDSLAQSQASVAASYGKGRSSYLSVLDANSRLQAAQDSRLIAQAAKTHAVISSFKALGGGWNDENSGARQSLASSR